MNRINHNHAIIPILSAAQIGVALLCILVTRSAAQGTVTFDSPWINSGIGYYTTYLDPAGLTFTAVNSYPGANLARVGAVLEAHPSNATSHLEFLNNAGGLRYVSFKHTLPRSGCSQWT